MQRGKQNASKTANKRQHHVGNNQLALIVVKNQRYENRKGAPDESDGNAGDKPHQKRQQHGNDKKWNV